VLFINFGARLNVCASNPARTQSRGTLGDIIMKHQAKFIVIDGPNGVGKTTTIHALEKLLVKNQLNYFLTKEPTNSELGCFIKTNQNILNKRTLACLIAGDRYEHLENVVLPNLKLGKIVISDRYLPSSLVYQSIDDLKQDFILAINRDILIPDLTIILTTNPSKLKERIESRTDKTRFETDELKEVEIEKYNSSYQILKNLGHNAIKIENSNLTIEDIAENIFSKILNIL
jgi:dTMP kinase